MSMTLYWSVAAKKLDSKYCMVYIVVTHAVVPEYFLLSFTRSVRSRTRASTDFFPGVKLHPRRSWPRVPRSLVVRVTSLSFSPFLSCSLVLRSPLPLIVLRSVKPHQDEHRASRYTQGNSYLNTPRRRRFSSLSLGPCRHSSHLESWVKGL